MLKKIIAVLLSASMILTGCAMEEKKEEKKVSYGIRVYNKDELENGFYYIKHGDEFYQIKDGEASFVEGNEETDYDYSLYEEDQPDATRSFFYERDKSEKMIPTMYQDDELVYKTQNDITSVFEWERFVDAGYTFGIRNIRQADSGAYAFTNYFANLSKNSAFAKKIGYSMEAENENASYKENTDYEEGEEPEQGESSSKEDGASTTDNEDINAYWEYAISSIKNDKGFSLYDEHAVSSSAVSVTGSAVSQQISQDILSPAGTIKGLDPNLEYTVNIHKGTRLYQVKTKPDVRLFYNFENYWTKGISFSEDGYATIAIPKAFKSGYYKCANSGLFRYVDQPYQENFDLGKVNFNQAYYKREYYDDGTEKDIQYKKVVKDKNGTERELDEYIYE